MDKAYTSIVFTGKDLEEGTISARDFASALLTVTRLCERAYELINERNKSELDVRVKSHFKTGSFEIALEIDLPSSEHLEYTAEDILNFIGIGSNVSNSSTSLIQLKKRIQRKDILKIKFRNENVIIKLMDGTEIRVKEAVWTLYQDDKINNQLFKLVAPITSEQIATPTKSEKILALIKSENLIDSNEFKKITARIESEKTPTKKEVTLHIEVRREGKIIDDITEKDADSIKEDEKYRKNKKSKDRKIGEKREENVELRVDTPQFAEAYEKSWSFSICKKKKRGKMKKKVEFVVISAKVKDKNYIEKVIKGAVSFKRETRISCTLTTITYTRKIEYTVDNVIHKS